MRCMEAVPRRAVALLALGFAAGCGGGTPGGGGALDLAGEDRFIPGEDAGGDVPGGDRSGEDLPAPRDLAGVDSWGDWGQPCTDNGDCESGYCVEVAEGISVCTIPCIEECPSDWVCQGFNSGPDVIFLCVPPWSSICAPCALHTDCVFDGNLCIPVGEGGGTYCGVDCAGGQPCPEHYHCEEIEDGEGKPLGAQCVPDTGSCICTWALNGTTEACAVENGHGTCFGESTCDGPAGWTPCDAAVPAEEDCNGLDDDCDGGADEGLGEGPCTVENEHGICAGIRSCGGAAGWACDAAVPAAETCNGLDDDCDGDADEGFPDTDGDGDADCFDLDDDGDGVLDLADNCPLVPNLSQLDTDGDGEGDLCDGDDDDDGIPDGEDNCPLVPNPDQTDTDGNGEGDACDGDADGDGFPDEVDCEPLDVFSFPGAAETCDSVDNDCDGLTDEDFPDTDGDGSADCLDGDDDGDGDPDLTDCEPLDPAIHHAATEICNGVDDDCDGLADPGCEPVAVWLDWPMGALRAVTAELKADLVIGRPLGGAVVTDGEGLKLTWGLRWGSTP
ncbi:MAG: putative metal-binding motif-containing protein [Deltaproteobacteria bacterium]|nr:putative metal-binding motif-containing protein [Deltaproteobacteria bacterium]